MKKILFLDTGFDSTSEFFRKQRELVPGCTNVCLYRRQNRGILQKIIQAVGIYIFPPILYLIYGSWKKHLDEYDMFIVASRQSAKYAIKFLKKKTGKRVVVWYWNLVTSKELNPEDCRKYGCETWSFDKEDCKKYGMNFGDTYYFPGVQKNDIQNSKYTMFYVGINRPGRETLLENVGKVLKDSGKDYFFNLTAIPTEPKVVQERYAKRLTYGEIVDYIQKSDSILDLNRENQSGMTLRPMEALFFGKKLITNNEHIIHYKLFTSSNMFILRDNNLGELVEFLEKPLKPYNSDLIKHYSFSSWLDRIKIGSVAE